MNPQLEYQQVATFKEGWQLTSRASRMPVTVLAVVAMSGDFSLLHLLALLVAVIEASVDLVDRMDGMILVYPTPTTATAKLGRASAFVLDLLIFVLFLYRIGAELLGR